jgi:hypothetical protein
MIQQLVVFPNNRLFQIKFHHVKPDIEGTIKLGGMLLFSCMLIMMPLPFVCFSAFFIRFLIPNLDDACLQSHILLPSHR